MQPQEGPTGVNQGLQGVMLRLCLRGLPRPLEQSFLEVSTSGVCSRSEFRVSTLTASQGN